MQYHKMKAAEVSGHYIVTEQLLSEADIYKMARQLAKKRLAKGTVVGSPMNARCRISTLMTNLEHEVFAILFMDQKHRVIQFEEMFRGTIDSASVYPREVVKRALELNAAACIVAHNHPSGCSEPSASDIALTKRLKEALELVDIRLLDHFVVGSEETVSFAEKHLL